MEFSGTGAIGVDEAKMSLTNNWGTVVMGDDDGASDIMMVGGYSLLTAAFGYDGGPTSQLQRAGISFTTVFASLTGDTGDATKISYFTPRWNGLQLGASFTPDSGATFDDNLAGDGDNDGDTENSLGAGINYNNKIGDVGVRVGITGMTATAEPNTSAGGAGLARDDISTWSAGGTLSYSGFSIGTGYGDNGDLNCTKVNALCDAGDWWDVAGQYKFGSTTIAGGFKSSEDNVTGVVGSEDSVDVWTLGVSHNFASAPGLRAWAEISQWDLDRVGTTSDNDATYIVIGTQVAF